MVPSPVQATFFPGPLVVLTSQSAPGTVVTVAVSFKPGSQSGQMASRGGSIVTWDTTSLYLTSVFPSVPKAVNQKPALPVLVSSLSALTPPLDREGTAGEALTPAG